VVGSIDHVTIRVSDFVASRGFYDTVLAPLGLVDAYVGDGFVELGDFSIARPKPGEVVTRALHIAFAASSREQVDSFHTAATAAGHRSNGAPGERPEYHPGYYGAFVFDPDGNNVEAVFHDRPTDGLSASS
jgi:catechol 2,3-dioxygenase-like lactoylglutathione lyase family enzyme